LVRGRTFDLITQGESIEQFESLRTDLWRLSLAFYAGELIDRFTEDQHPVPGLFESLLSCLRLLTFASVDAGLILRKFELEVLGLTGYRPQLYACVSCATEIKPQANGFSYADGGVLCPDCASKSSSAFLVGIEALRILRNLQTRPELTIQKLHTSAMALEESEHVLIGYIQYLLDLRLRSVGFIDLVRNMQSLSVGTAAI
jgi:DNA repair protein RecO (recombination protein O)